MHGPQPCRLENDSLLNMVRNPLLDTEWRGPPFVCLVCYARPACSDQRLLRTRDCTNPQNVALYRQDLHAIVAVRPAAVFHSSCNTSPPSIGISSLDIFHFKQPALGVGTVIGSCGQNFILEANKTDLAVHTWPA